MEDGKKPYLSKTLWTNLIMAILPFVPGLNVWISAHLEFFGVFWGVVNAILRLVTKDKIQLN